jgi:hypothetical protein
MEVFRVLFPQEITLFDKGHTVGIDLSMYHAIGTKIGYNREIRLYIPDNGVDQIIGLTTFYTEREGEFKENLFQLG